MSKRKAVRRPRKKAPKSRGARTTSGQRKAPSRKSAVRKTKTVPSEAATLDIPVPSALELWPLERLKPYERNPRKHSSAQISRIAHSIRTLGFNDPIAVSRDDGIVEGHGRLLAARRLGLERVPIIRLDHLTEAQRRAYLVAHNKIALLATWDKQVLSDELDAIETSGLDLELTGFDEDELEALEASLSDVSPGGGKARPRATTNILQMLHFDTVEQRETWLRFAAWLQSQPPQNASFASKLTTFVDAAMGSEEGA